MVRVVLGEGSPSKITLYTLKITVPSWCFCPLCPYILKIYNEAKDYQEFMITCGICLELLDDPKSMPCLHTYCKKCLMEAVANRPQDTLPKTRPKPIMPA